MPVLAPAGPSTRAGRTRLAGVDAARGLAVLGMVAVHVLPGETDDGGVALSEAVAGGRSSAAFAVLAGVGVALATRGTDRGRQRVRLVLRALLIGALGLWLGGLDTQVAVILAYYAVFFLLLLPFLGWPPRRLLLTAGGRGAGRPGGQLPRPVAGWTRSTSPTPRGPRCPSRCRW